jgi:acyl-CoA reductase-like NAD-dependent aldehyde dehydrogenase
LEACSWPEPLTPDSTPWHCTQGPPQTQPQAHGQGAAAGRQGRRLGVSLDAVAVARGLDAAMVCINRHNDTPVEVSVSMSKQSGIGWLGGDEGLLEYLQAHTIVL